MNSNVIEPQPINYDLPYIREIPFNLSREFCNEVIEKFEEDENKHQGVFGRLQVNKKIKNSMDLVLNDEKWQQESQLFYAKLYDACDNWMREHHRMINLNFPNGRMVNSAIQVQKTVPGKTGYVWHSDDHIFWNEQPGDEKPTLMRRYITFLWYLNDNDGYTEFQGRKVMPQAGKLLLFFADPCMIHRGIPPTEGAKYIATGWISVEVPIF